MSFSARPAVILYAFMLCYLSLNCVILSCVEVPDDTTYFYRNSSRTKITQKLSIPTRCLTSRIIIRLHLATLMNPPSTAPVHRYERRTEAPTHCSSSIKTKVYLHLGRTERVAFRWQSLLITNTQHLLPVTTVMITNMESLLRATLVTTRTIPADIPVTRNSSTILTNLLIPA